MGLLGCDRAHRFVLVGQRAFLNEVRWWLVMHLKKRSFLVLYYQILNLKKSHKYYQRVSDFSLRTGR